MGRSPPPITRVGGSRRERYATGVNWANTSARGTRASQSMKGAPPPATPCAAQVPFRLCLRQSPGTAPVRWCGLRFALPSAQLATPRLLPGACRSNRAASGRVGENPWLSEPPVLQPPTTVMGGGGAPMHFQFNKPDGQHNDHPREPPTTVMGGGDSPYQPKLNWLPYFINYFISSNYKSNRLL